MTARHHTDAGRRRARSLVASSLVSVIVLGLGGSATAAGKPSAKPNAKNRAARVAARLAARSQKSAAKPAANPSTAVLGVQLVNSGPGTPPLPSPQRIAAPRLDPAKLQPALDAWTRAQPDLSSMSITLRVGDQSWTSSSSNGATPVPDPLAVYRVMSVTKTMTSALILREVEAGRISLDDPLPPISGVDAPVPAGLTIRDLLLHRSGLVDYASAPGYRADLPMTPQMAVGLSFRAAAVAPPNTVTNYTNSNFLYLGLLLEQLEGRPYGDLIAGLVGPLSMPQTHLDPPDRPGWAGFSSGGVMSTTADIAKWGQALFTPGKVLSPASLTAMTTIGEGRTGLGLWGMCPCPGPDTKGPAGEAPFTAMGHHTAMGGMFVFEGNGFVLVMRADRDGGDTTARAMSLAKALRDTFRPQEPTPAAAS